MQSFLPGARRTSMLMAFSAMLPIFVVLFRWLPASATQPDITSLHALPQFRSVDVNRKQYTVDPYIRVAAKLQTLGKERACEIMRNASTGGDALDGEPVIVLCRMLFTAKPNAEFRRPLIGGPNFVGSTEVADWRLEPIALIDGVPFAIVRGYTLAGRAESSEEYLNYCLRECDWRTSKFNPKSFHAKQKALEKLLTATRWNGPLIAEDQEFLSSQIR